jgi:nucleoid-associated protein YgaU
MVLLASSYDQSRFLKAADLKGEKKFRIKNVTEELVGTEAQKEKKLVVWFTNDERGLVLNKTNNRAIRGAYGDDTAGWVGKIIAVFPTMVDMRGKMTPALRVRIPPPKQAAAAAPAGNGAAAVAPTQKLMAAAPAVDPELEEDPVKPLADELNDEINF